MSDQKTWYVKIACEPSGRVEVLEIEAISASHAITEALARFKMTEDELNQEYDIHARIGESGDEKSKGGPDGSNNS